MAVESRHLPMDVRQRLPNKYVDPAQQMRLGNPLIELKRIKELTLIGRLASHHQRNPFANREKKTESRQSRQGNEFFNSIDPKRPVAEVPAAFAKINKYAEHGNARKTPLNCEF
jgi:hypothetical protein